MSDPADDDLAERVAALEATLDELRDEVEPDRGPLGLPRPPSPRQVLRVTDEYAIPAAIAILEANVRTLELLQVLLRGVRGAPHEDEVRERATSLGRTTVERVDRALTELQSALEDENLPRNADARRLLEEARDLNEEVRAAVTPNGATAEGDEAVDEDGSDDATTPGTDGDDTDGGATSVEVDVDAELASIKDQVDAAESDDRAGADESDEHPDDE